MFERFGEGCYVICSEICWVVVLVVYDIEKRFVRCVSDGYCVCCYVFDDINIEMFVNYGVKVDGRAR